MSIRDLKRLKEKQRSKRSRNASLYLPAEIYLCSHEQKYIFV